MNMDVRGTTQYPEIFQGKVQGSQTVYTSTPSTTNVVLDLKSVFFLRSIKMTLWFWDSRYYTYTCSVSEDGENWVPLCENWMARCNETLVVMRQVRFIKLQGTNSANAYLHIVGFKLN